MLAFMIMPVTSADAETRKLKLYYLHTGEKAEITFKKNGRYVKSGLKKVNRFLRDWRRNEPTKMNPKLMDLIWEVYKETGSRKYIHVISGYRSPATNSLLRKRGRGVAKKSQHTLGNALDFFIPGVSLRKLRNIGLKKGIGGVGYYPKSGSPFVHMDTGRVRHWPRMSRRELVKVFPRGKTLHVPTDGKPLPGYNIAKANYERKIKGGFKVPSGEEIKKKPGLLAKLFSRDSDDEAGISGATSAPKAVKAKPVKPKEPAVKPAEPAIVTPEPISPEPTPTPEVLIAALNPNQVPVPVAAPRIAIVKPPEPEVIPVAETTEVASLEPVAEEDTTLQETALAIPVPAKRPQVEIETVPTLAIVEPEPVANEPVEVAALSANEISDLRQQVYSALESKVEAPKPVNIPFQPATKVVEPANPFSPPTKLQPSDLPSLIVSAPDAIEQQIATVQPIDPEASQTTGVPVPSTKPTSEPSLVTALLPLEKDTKSTGGISIPTPSPVLLPEVAEPVQTTANTVPVPQRATRPTQVAKVIETPTPAKTKEKTLDLEEFKTANLDERLTGKWALATDASIKDIADIQPPAYGRNILRQLPSSVLSSGFSQNQIGSITNSFSGSSVEFLDFKRFK